MQEQEEITLSTGEKGWLGKIKDGIYENWQTILVALIVLIVGISAYNYNSKAPAALPDESQAEQTPSENASQQTAAEGAAQNQDQAAAATVDQAGGDVKTAETTKAEGAENKTTATTAVVVEGENYKVTAVRGEGLTHLARRALGQYLAENKDDQITEAHRVYIEDYLRKHVSAKGGINIGHEETFTKAQIEAAIAASKQLSQKSLDNLQKYTVQ